MAANNIEVSLVTIRGDREKREPSTNGLAAVYQRLYLLGVRAEKESRRRELASNDQADPDPEMEAGEGFIDGEEPEREEL